MCDVTKGGKLLAFSDKMWRKGQNHEERLKIANFLKLFGILQVHSLKGKCYCQLATILNKCTCVRKMAHTFVDVFLFVKSHKIQLIRISFVVVILSCAQNGKIFCLGVFKWFYVPILKLTLFALLYVQGGVALFIWWFFLLKNFAYLFAFMKLPFLTFSLLNSSWFL